MSSQTASTHRHYCKETEEQKHARRQEESRFFAMSKAVLTSKNYHVDDAQADLIETENHGRLFIIIGGTRHLCISGVT